MADVKLSKTSREHCIKRIVERYDNLDDASAGVVVDRLLNALKNQTPPDWRFTTSSSARFFVLDQETKVKLLGVSYRNAGSELLAELRRYAAGTPKAQFGIEAFLSSLDGFRQQYRSSLLDPTRSVAHELKTAYPPGVAGTISMEKRIAKTIIELTGQPEVVSPAGVASRPNVIVAPTGMDGKYCVWARQYGTWSLPSGQGPGTEYLYFERLTPEGLDKGHRAVFRITPDGETTRLETPVCPHETTLCLFKAPRGKDCIPPNLRSESYWTLPVLLDRCYYDLDYSLTHFDTSWYVPNTLDVTLFRMLEAVIRSGGQRATEY